MSLILDALRKAEAERQRGSVPGLHGVAVAPAPEASPASRPWARAPLSTGLWMLLALLALGALTVWAWRARATAPAPAAAALRAEAPMAPATPVAQAPVPPLPVVVSAPPAAAPAPGPVAPAAPVAEAPRAPAAPILTQVRRLADLPPEQRQALPPLVVGGSVWSDQAAVRFVVLDGQVLREGDTVAPGLVLLKLAPRAATLRWRDSLLEVPF